MPAAAFDRARKLWKPRQGAVLWTHLLGVIHSFLILGLLILGGMLVGLVTNRGEAWAPPPTADSPALPWLISPIANRSDGQQLYQNTGLYPIVTELQRHSNPVPRSVAAGLLKLIERVRPLHNNQGALTTLMAVGLGVFLVLSMVAQARRSAIAQTSHEVATALRRQIHRQMYRLGESSLPSEGTGPILSLFTREVNDVRDGLAAELDVSIRVPVLILGLLLLSLTFSGAYTAFLLALGTLVWLLYRYLNRSAELAAVLAARESALQLCLLQEDFGLIRTVRVHGMENIDKQRFDEHLERYEDAEIRRMRNDSRISPAAILLLCASATLGLGFLVEVVVGKGQPPASVLVLIVSLLMTIRPSIEWLAGRRAIRLGKRSAEGVFSYLDRKPELHQAGGAMFLPPLRDRISFENVTLENSSGRVLLDGLTVEIVAGSKTTIMSLDEEAKLALVCLIPRLIDPKVGKIRIDGIDLRDVTLESVRSQVSTVLQADLVFSDTVFANIALGDTSYDLPRVIEAAKVAHAHHFIQDLPQGYDTIIGQLGTYLKPDQQYRIALARAFLHDPSIVIIEEPEATLDDDTKAYLDDTVARMAPGRTLIMLPHRLSTIRSSDQVIVIHNGKLEATGTPTEVKGESKLYRHLQYIEFNKFASGEIEEGQIG